LSETPRTRAIVVTKLIKVDAHREGRRYIVHSHELLSAFLEMEATLLCFFRCCLLGSLNARLQTALLHFKPDEAGVASSPLGVSSQATLPSSRRETASKYLRNNLASRSMC